MSLVKDLCGEELDSMVALANGWLRTDFVGFPEYIKDGKTMYAGVYQPSTDWSVAGEIIERERIDLIFFDGWWFARKQGGGSYSAPAPMIAAMQAYVASKFGNVLPDANKNECGVDITVPPNVELTGEARRAESRERSERG